MYITHPVLYVSQRITYGTNYSATFYKLNAVHRSFFIKLFFKLPERAGDAPVYKTSCTLCFTTYKIRYQLQCYFLYELNGVHQSFFVKLFFKLLDGPIAGSHEN